MAISSPKHACGSVRISLVPGYGDQPIRGIASGDEESAGDGRLSLGETLREIGFQPDPADIDRLDAQLQGR